MSQELPEDFKDWPRDPFKLLGIDRHSDLKSAKRAYIKRIKKFKPDKFPAEFQRIHEAFENVQNWLSWQRRGSDDADPSDEESESQTSESASSIPSRSPGAEPGLEISSNTSGPIANRPESPTTDPLEKFQAALLSDDLNAAAHLLKSAGSHSSPHIQSRASLMLYCLLDSVESRASADSEAKNQLTTATERRIDCLLKALGNEKMFFSAFSGLSREFDFQPATARLSNVQQTLLNLRNPRSMLALLQLRWRAAGCKDWRVVLDDLQALEPNSLSLGDIWPQILVESLEYTIWHSDQRCVDHSIQSWKELSSNHHELFTDDLEILILAAQQWRQLPDIFHGKAMIPFARTLLPGEHRRYWESEARLIAEAPHQSLNFLTHLHLQFPCATILFQQGLKKYSDLVVSETDLSELDDDDEDDFAEFSHRDQLACFFKQHDGSNYGLSRIAVLDYCISQHMKPAYFGYLASTFQRDDAAVSWEQLIREDTALQCVYYASL